MCEWPEGQPQDVTSTRDYSDVQTVTDPITTRPNAAVLDVWYFFMGIMTFSPTAVPASLTSELLSIFHTGSSLPFWTISVRLPYYNRINKAVLQKNEGTRWRSWLTHCATSRKVAGSIPDIVIGFFHWHNSSSRTMAMGSTQPPTEMSTRNVSWG